MGASGYTRCLGALRGLTFAALDCLYALDFETFPGFQAFFVALVRCTAGFCFASMLAEKPKLSASASTSARNLIPLCYCATRANHKYIFRKLTAVNKMHTQEAPRHSFSVQEPSKRGKPAR